MNPTGVIAASPILICSGDDGGSAWGAGAVDTGGLAADAGGSGVFIATVDLFAGGWWGISDVLACPRKLIEERTANTAMNKTLNVLLGSKLINRNPFCGS